MVIMHKNNLFMYFFQSFLILSVFLRLKIYVYAFFMHVLYKIKGF